MVNLGSQLDRIRVSETGIHPVSRIVFDLTDSDAFERAIEYCVHWMAPKTKAGIPPRAELGEAFDISDVYGANPCRAVRLDARDGRVWSARLDEHDGANRTWISELYLEQFESKTRFGCQLICANKSDHSFSMSRPSVVRDMLTEFSAEADGWQFDSRPLVVDDVESFVSLLYDPSRRLPVVLAAQHQDSALSAADSGRIWGRVSGAAHVFQIDPALAWEMTRYLGKQMSCFNGAVRIYMPGLAEEREDPFEHPLWLMGPRGPQSWIVDAIASRVLPLGFLPKARSGHFPRFAEVRDAVVRTELKSNAGLSEAKRLQLEIDLLRIEIESSRDDRNTWEALAGEEQDRRLKAEAEAERLGEEILRLRAKAQVLESGLRRDEPRREVARPNNFDELEDWSAQELGGDVVILPPAFKDCRKNGHNRTLARLLDVLLIVRDYVVPAKRGGGLDAMALAKAKLTELGFEDSKCFVNPDHARQFPAYFVMYRGEKRYLSDHLKFGNGTDNANQIRVYYFWDVDQKKFVVGKMPSHLPNNLTN